MPWRTLVLPSRIRSRLRTEHFNAVQRTYSRFIHTDSDSNNIPIRRVSRPKKSPPTSDKSPSTPKPFIAKHARLLGDGNRYRPEQVEGDMVVAGLLRSIRKQKHQAFAHLDDGTTYEPLQAVLPPDLAKNLTNGAYVELTGKWQDSPAKGQAHELQVSSISSVGKSDPEENPIQKQSMSTDYLRSIPHMRIRTPFHSLLARTRSHVLRSISEHFDQSRRQAVIQVHPPLITSSDCEGAGEVFTISPRSHAPVPAEEADGKTTETNLYFREPKYLTVSSQLHLEAWAAELGEVWSLSPTFRAEESDTPRHLAEFYMLEAEFRGQGHIEAAAGRVSHLIRSIVKNLRSHRTGKELVQFVADRKHRPADADQIELEERWNKLDQNYTFVSYTDAIEALKQAHSSKNGGIFKNAPDWHKGLQLEHERWIVENLGNNAPIYVLHYPKAIKPFYMLPSNASDLARGVDQPSNESPGETVACFDLLLPYGWCEVAGGSLREHRLENLIQSMREKGLIKQHHNTTQELYPYLQPGESLGSLQWYADLRRYGSSRHGGFGLGFDRLLAYLTGMSNVRDVVGFPRAWGRADC